MVGQISMGICDDEKMDRRVHRGFKECRSELEAMFL